MSTGDLGPSDPLQALANALARALAEGNDLAWVQERFPHLFETLSRAEIREARRYALQVDLIRQWSERNPELPLSAAPGFLDLPPGVGGLTEVLVPFGERDPETGLYQEYRQVDFATNPALSANEIDQLSRWEVYDWTDYPDYEIADDIKIRLIPFNRYED